MNVWILTNRMQSPYHLHIHQIWFGFTTLQEYAMGCNTEYFTKDVSLNASKNALQSYYIFSCLRSSVPTLLTDQKKRRCQKKGTKSVKKSVPKMPRKMWTQVSEGGQRCLKVVESGWKYPRCYMHLWCRFFWQLVIEPSFLVHYLICLIPIRPMKSKLVMLTLSSCLFRSQHSSLPYEWVGSPYVIKLLPNLSWLSL